MFHLSLVHAEFGFLGDEFGFSVPISYRLRIRRGWLMIFKATSDAVRRVGVSADRRLGDLRLRVLAPGVDRTSRHELERGLTDARNG